MLKLSSMSKFSTMFLGAIIGIFLSCGIYYATVHYSNKTEESGVMNNLSEYLEHSEETFTVEDRIKSWEMEKKFDISTKLYYELPQIILERILTEIGAEASVEQIYDQYNLHKKFYLQLQLAKEIDKVTINGPDKDNIEKAEISIELKEPSANSKDIPITPSKQDTIIGSNTTRQL